MRKPFTSMYLCNLKIAPPPSGERYLKTGRIYQHPFRAIELKGMHIPNSIRSKTKLEHVKHPNGKQTKKELLTSLVKHKQRPKKSF